MPHWVVPHDAKSTVPTIAAGPPHRGKSARAAEARARAERAGRQTTIRGLVGREVAVAAAREGTGIAGTIST